MFFRQIHTKVRAQRENKICILVSCFSVFEEGQLSLGKKQDSFQTASDSSSDEDDDDESDDTEDFYLARRHRLRDDEVN